MESSSTLLAGVQNKKAFSLAAQFIADGLAQLAESAGDRERLTATMTPAQATAFTDHWVNDLIVVRPAEDGSGGDVTHIGSVPIPSGMKLPKNVLRIVHSDNSKMF